MASVVGDPVPLPGEGMCGTATMGVVSVRRNKAQTPRVPPFTGLDVGAGEGGGAHDWRGLFKRVSGSRDNTAFSVTPIIL